MKTLLPNHLRCLLSFAGFLFLVTLMGCEPKAPDNAEEVSLLRKENAELLQKNEELSEQVEMLRKEISEQESFDLTMYGKEIALSQIKDEAKTVQGFIDEVKSDRAKLKKFADEVIEETKELLALSEEELHELDPLFGKIDTVYSTNEGLARARALQERLVEENEKLRSQLEEQGK